MHWIKLLTSYFAGILVFLISGCLTDGPNRTGGAYLEEQGVIVSRSLDSVEVLDFPVDSFWVESAQNPVIGASYLTVGRLGNFTSVGRLGFGIAARDSAVLSDSLLLVLTPFIQDSLLKITLNQSLEGVDSLFLEVRSAIHRMENTAINTPARNFFEWFADIDEHAAGFSAQLTADTLLLENPKLLFDTLAGIPFSLPNLHASISGDTSMRFAFLEISLLDASANPGMLRLTPPVSLKLKNAAGTQLDSAVRFSFIPKGGSQSMTAFRTTHLLGEPPATVLTGPAQGVTFLLNRSALLNAVGSSAAFAFDWDDGSGFNNQFYVPYAEITVPIDTSAMVEGAHGVKLQLNSSLDSIIGPPTGEGAWIFTPTGETIPSPFYLELTFSRSVDSLRFHYFQNDSLGHYYLAVNHSVDATKNDTVKISNFSPFTYNHRSQFSVHVVPDSSGAWIQAFIPFNESLNFEDIARRQKNFMPGASSVTLEASHGVQKLFNRAADPDLLDFDFRMTSAGAFAMLDSTQTNLTFPISAEVPLRLDTQGNLRVDLKIFLMRLR